MAKHIFELMYSKDFRDGRKVDDDMLREIEKSWKDKMKAPVARGHMSAMGWMGDDNPADGWVKKVWFDENSKKLKGEVHLNDQMERDYKAGKYSAWSVGIHSRGIYDETGNKISREPWELGHLAMLGSTEAAFKDLEECNDDQSFSDISNPKSSIKFFTRGDKEFMLFADSDLVEEIKSKKAVTENAYTNNEEVKQMDELQKQFAETKLENERLSAQLKAFQAEKLETEKGKMIAKKNAVISLSKEKGINPDSEIGKQIENLFENQIQNFSENNASANYAMADAFMAIFGFLRSPVDAGEKKDFSADDMKEQPVSFKNLCKEIKI